MAVAAPTPRPRLAPFGRMAGPLGLLKEVARRPAGLFGLVVVGGLIVLAIFAPLIAPYDPAEQDIQNRLQGPSGTICWARTSWAAICSRASSTASASRSVSPYPVSRPHS